MKSSCNKQDTVEKYASYKNPDLATYIKTSFGVNQYTQSWQQQRKNIDSARVDDLNDKSEKISLKTRDNTVLNHSIQLCPFTFLTALKRKLPLGKYPTCKKAHESEQSNKVPEGTMDLIKPLKVPDLKISPKADYSSRESLLSNEELSKKIEAVQRDEMALKSNVKRLDFSSSSTTSMLNYENVEPLRVPDFAMSKKKDLSRDSSREKENRSKRLKKDDLNKAKIKDDTQSISKWSKSQRHISRKEIADSIINRKFNNDHILVHGLKDTDIIFKKSKNKSVTTSTNKKDEDKRQKHANISSVKLKKDKSVDSKNRTSSSESLYPLDKGSRLHDKILIREGYKAMISEISDQKHRDDSQIINTSKQLEDQKYKSHSEARIQNRLSKCNVIKPIESLTRDQNKRTLDKQRPLSKTDSKQSSEISEDLTTAANSTASLEKSTSFVIETASSLNSKSKEADKCFQTNNNRNYEESKFYDSFSNLSPSNPVSSSTVIETKFSQDNSLSEKLMDPLRISFREDSYSNVPGFSDLVSPNINLMIRPKKRKNIFQERELENNGRDLKKCMSRSSHDVEETHLKQLQAEMNLLDSFSESLRQVIHVERSRLSNEDVKKHTASLQTYKDIDSKNTESETAGNKDNNKHKIQKSIIKVVEVQTQTANDIATQTETMLCQHGVNTSFVYLRDTIDSNEMPHISLNSEDRYENMDRVEDISLPSKMRTMSEISLHETTSSIKTETGTEISISTRGVTCSFNKYLDLEMAQLIEDERQRYGKIEMLFKSHEKTLKDRTKKLVKLEEQKRALRDTGQDSRISSVRKKQRALLLKLQQEKDEMNRLKELHKIASQERKLMLQKQRDMFNPEMSTKNILNKLKRSADSQSPRRLSGPMKGYDIRSNSSISSLVDSDKSQFDRSQFDCKLNLSNIVPQKNDQSSSKLELDTSLKQVPHTPDNIDKKLLKVEVNKQQKEPNTDRLKYDLKTRKFEEKMPKSDILKLKSHRYDLDAILKHGASAVNLMNSESHASLSQLEDDKSISEHNKLESDTLVEELARIWKLQFPDIHPENLNLFDASESLEALKELHRASPSKRLDKESIKKLQQYISADYKNAKRKGVKTQRIKLIQPELTSKSEDWYSEEASRHHKRSKIESEQQSDENYQNSILEELDFNESQSSLQALLKHSSLLRERNQKLLQDIVDEHNHATTENSESPLSQKEEDENIRGGNASSRSHVSLTISHQSSNDSDRSYSRSVVIRSQQDHHNHSGMKTSKKLEQILNAREATLVSRRNCVEEWIAWHARLREEENRVARMEQAAYKLVSATSKALSHNDTTVSSDTSDVEGRIELLTQKLADRRLEMARLKKEARKQAKQRLRELEANLLNQIKKYDATILEMRKKLDLKRASTKDGEKLAIESKSVVDFKVPQIPIKKIQEIYKSCDLLRSKSDSEIISSRSQESVEKPKDEQTKSTDADKHLSKNKSNEEFKPISSHNTIDDEDHESEKSENSAVQSYKTKSNSEEIATQKSITETPDIKRCSSQNSNISEEITSEAYSIKSPTEQIQTAKISDTQISDYVPERLEISKQNVKKSSNIEEEWSPGSDDTSLMFSRKLDHIQLHNKELNNDIHTLENDLKELTEMMSNYSKKSDDKNLKLINVSHKTDVETSSSKNISEELPTSEIVIHTEVIDQKKQLISEHVDKSTETEEILTHLPYNSSATNRELLSSVNIETEVNTVSEIVSVSAQVNKESVSSNKSEYSIQSALNSSDNIINSQIETDNSSNRMRDSTVHEFARLKDSREISAYQVTPSKLDDNKALENELHLTSKDRYIKTNISTAEDVLVSLGAALKNKEGKNETIHENNYTEDENSEIKEISADQTESVQIEQKEITAEETSASTEIESKVIYDVKMSSSKETDNVAFKENVDTKNLFNKNASSDNDWTLSDSFEIQQIDIKESKSNVSQLEETVDEGMYKNDEGYCLSDIDDSSLFVPKGESTNIQETFVLRLDDSNESRIGIRTDEFNDILEIIERETKNTDQSSVKVSEPAILNTENPNLSKVNDKNDIPIECDVSVIIKSTGEESESIDEEIETKNDVSASENCLSEKFSEKSLEDKDEDLPEIEIGVKIELIDEGDDNSKSDVQLSSSNRQDKVQVVEVLEIGSEDRGSSDGEQTDNLIEVAEGKLDIVEKRTPVKETSDEKIVNDTAKEKPKTHVTVFLNKTFEVIKDPGYEDISEESLEISEIFDISESHSQKKSKKFTKIPEKYVIKSKSDEVLRILDEISNKSSNIKDETRTLDLNNKTGTLEITRPEVVHEKQESSQVSPTQKLNDLESTNATKATLIEEVSKDKFVELEEIKSAPEDEAQQKQDDLLKIASESSDLGDLDTPRGISEIDMDSPREINEESRLDVEALDDDLLSTNTLLQTYRANDTKTEFHKTSMDATSEKDIEAMIKKLEASTEQPGLEVAELEAKLLQIENLQIELEIKKLEALEESYYVREIPNKPPPPYTPPGVVRVSSSHGSPSLPPAVIPSNLEELTAITEKATEIIYRDKQSVDDVLMLEAPSEICELAKDTGDDALKKDRRIYNTFLFDLCKELVSEMYRSEHEKPGPSWVKPNVKTKPAVKVARSVAELNDYVSKEVATLFGFKTKLQRENMVMMWSRKRRDRVDELLAKEAQAEEKEWTKFHHDELAVKNELTMKILDTLIAETTGCVKAAYAKKRKIASS